MNLQKREVKSASLSTKRKLTYLQSSHRSMIWGMIGWDNKLTSNIWNRLGFYGTNLRVVMLIESTNVFVSNKNLRRNLELRKNRGRQWKGIKIRNCLGSKSEIEKLKKKNFTNSIKLKWSKKKEVTAHLSHHPTLPKPVAIVVVSHQLLKNQLKRWAKDQLLRAHWMRNSTIKTPRKCYNKLLLISQ